MTTKKELPEYLADATRFLAEKDYAGALKEYKGVLKLQPDHLEALKGAGMCSYNLRDNIAGLKYFQKAIAIAPNDATSLYYLASLSVLNEKFPEAIEYANKVIDFRPDFFDAYKILFTIYLKLQKFDAIFELNKRFEEQKVDVLDDTVHVIVATTYMLQKKYNVALELFKTANKIDPTKTQTINNIGVCYMSLKKYDEAINAFEKSIELDNKNSITYTNLGTVLQLKGEFLKALDAFNKALEVEPDSFMNLLNVANLSNVLRRYNMAIASYEKMLKINPDLKDIRSTLIGAYVKNGQPDKAINLIDTALKQTPRNVPLLFRKAKIYTDMGDFTAASKIYEQIVTFKKNSPAIYHAYAVLYTKMNNYDKALQYLNKALGLDENNAAVHKDLGVIYLMRNQVDYAKDEFDKAIKLGDTDNDILKEGADFYYSISDFAKADELYRRSLKIENNPYTRLSLGINLIAQNKIEEAFATLEPLMSSLPDNAELLYNLARIFYIQKDYDKASRLARKAYYIVPTIEIANLMGLCQKELEDYKGAAGIFEKIIEQYAINKQVYIDLISCYEKLGNTQAIIDTYKKANEHLIYDEERVIKLANLLSKNGKKDEAKQLLDKANFDHPSENLTQEISKL
ncbi:MAG: tetratricopeptide repeat protein [bacterium]|nr:tetratricopeptide repeat protein [bacterium]